MSGVEMSMIVGGDTPLPQPRPSVPGVDRCERCGTDVMLLDLVDEVRAVFYQATGQTSGRAGMPTLAWHEIHRWVSDSGCAESMTWRPHTPELCDRARAGDPVPVDRPSWADDEVEDDDED